VVAADERGMAAAARRLYLTPSGVSRRVQGLSPLEWCNSRP
jgi:DNA-binding transcriptional LysR family regulator